MTVDGIADLHISHVRCDSCDDAGDFVRGYRSIERPQRLLAGLNLPEKA
jgi:hypothetical protein